MSFYSAFQNDPFFSGVELPRAPALEHRLPNDNSNRQVAQRNQNNDQAVDVLGNPFLFMQSMMNSMGQMMTQMETRMNSRDFSNANGQGLSYMSSTVMSMDKQKDGQPRIVQATSEKLHGPEGLERTCKALRDTGRNLEKMEVSHRLGERTHRIIKERDPSTGKLLENRECHHIEDENAFEREWFNRAEKYGLKNSNGNSFNTHTNNLLMAPSSSNGHRRSQSQQPRPLAIEPSSTSQNSTNNNSNHKERRRN